MRRIRTLGWWGLGAVLALIAFLSGTLYVRSGPSIMPPFVLPSELRAVGTNGCTVEVQRFDVPHSAPPGFPSKQGIIVTPTK